MKDQRPITIRDLYPDMTEPQLQEAEANLRRYIAIIWRIYERLKAEGRPWPGLPARGPAGDLTVPPGSSTIPTERSNSHINH